MNNPNESCPKSARKRKSKLHRSTMWLSGVLVAAVTMAGLVNAWVTSQTATAQSPRPTESLEANRDAYESANVYRPVGSEPAGKKQATAVYEAFDAAPPPAAPRPAAFGAAPRPSGGIRPQAAATTQFRLPTNLAQNGFTPATSSELRSGRSGTSPNFNGTRPVLNAVQNQYGRQMSTRQMGAAGGNTYAQVPDPQQAINYLVTVLRSNGERDPPSGDDAAAAREQLEALVAQQFAERHKQQADKIAKLERDLGEAKKTHALRDESKSEIVSRRVKELLSEPDPLGWEPETRRSAKNSPQFYSRGAGYPVGVASTTAAPGFLAPQPVQVTRSAGQLPNQTPREWVPTSESSLNMPRTPTTSGFGSNPNPRQASSFSRPNTRSTSNSEASRATGFGDLPTTPPVPGQTQDRARFIEPSLDDQPQETTVFTPAIRRGDNSDSRSAIVLNSTPPDSSVGSALGLPDELNLQELRVKQMQRLYEKGVATQYELQQAQTQLEILKARFAFARRAADSDMDAQRQTLDLLRQQLVFAESRLEFAEEGHKNGISDAAAMLDRRSELLKLKAEIIEAQRRLSSTVLLLDHLSGSEVTSSASPEIDSDDSPISEPPPKQPLPEEPSSAGLRLGAPDIAQRPPVIDPNVTLPEAADLVPATPAIPAPIDDPLVPAGTDEPDEIELNEVESTDLGEAPADRAISDSLGL